MTAHHKLPVGFITPEGLPYRSVELDADKIVSDPPEDLESSSEGGLVIHRTLYREGERDRFVVHSLFEQRAGHIPLLARVQAYQSWAELMAKEPRLARSAA